MRGFLSFTLHIGFQTGGFIPTCFPQMLKVICFIPVRPELCDARHSTKKTFYYLSKTSLF